MNATWLKWPSRVAQKSRITVRVRQQSTLTVTPVIEKCPEPACVCASMPEGLDIDHSSNLKNTVAFHKRHIVVNTGTRSWPSRFEDDEGSYAAKVKNVFGKNGKLFDSRNTPLVSAGTWQSQPDSRMLIFPDFVSIPLKPSTQLISASGLLAGDRYFADDASQSQIDCLMDNLRKAYYWSNETARAPGLDDEFLVPLRAFQKIDKPVILICGHGSRDQRCGVLGPLLQTQFENALTDQGLNGIVGQITHIGGHKFAGNVILYVPPNHQKHHGFSEKSVWYGRVQPKHCEGIVKETIMGGKIIQELYRGSMADAGP